MSLDWWEHFTEISAPIVKTKITYYKTIDWALSCIHIQIAQRWCIHNFPKTPAIPFAYTCTVGLKAAKCMIWMKYSYSQMYKTYNTNCHQCSIYRFLPPDFFFSLWLFINQSFLCTPHLLRMCYLEWQRVCRFSGIGKI